jgi:DNA-binding NarL/FixJ family response regulator
VFPNSRESPKSIQVLLVDDFVSWRRLVESMLRARPELEIISQVSDGFEAVHKAEELQPELILMDIGIPKRNGLEAARQIRRLSPQSKIIFFSQQMSADVVHEAFVSGASGYVVKVDAGTELLLAVDVVLRGARFVGRRFSGLAFPETRLPPRESPARHEVGFYSAYKFLLDHLTHFIGTALDVGRSAIVVVTESHREDLFRRLRRYGVNVAAMIEQGRFISLDAAEAVSTFMGNGLPDPSRFLAVADYLITTAASPTMGEPARRVALCGECEPPLWTLSKGDAAIRVEQLWNLIGARYEVDILCAYSLPSHGAMDTRLFERICGEHSAIYSR